MKKDKNLSDVRQRKPWREIKVVVIFLLFVLIGIIIFVAYSYLFNKNASFLGRKDQSIEVSRLLEIGVNDQEKQIYGKLDWKTVPPNLSSGEQSVQLVINEDSIVKDATKDRSSLWVVVTGKLIENNQLLVSEINLLESDIHNDTAYFEQEAKKDFVIADSSVCEVDNDCAHFGKTGECDCGCHNENYIPLPTTEECFCLAPTSCACIEDKCEGLFE